MRRSHIAASAYGKYCNMLSKAHRLEEMQVHAHTVANPARVSFARSLIEASSKRQAVDAGPQLAPLANSALTGVPAR